MAQLNPSLYKKLTRDMDYGVSDGVYWDVTNSQLVLVIDDTVKAKIPLSQTSGRILTSDGTDLEPTAVTGDITVSGAGVSAIGAAKITAAMLGANLRTGYIPLDIFTARILSAGAIQNTTEAGVPDGNTSPSIARINAGTDNQCRLIWAAGDTTALQFAPVPYPIDLDDTAAVTVNLLAAMSGATNSPAIAVGYFEGVGDTDAGGNVTVSGTTVTKYTRTIAASDIGVYPNVASISLTPAAHAADAIHLYSAWLEYTRKT